MSACNLSLNFRLTMMTTFAVLFTLSLALLSSPVEAEVSGSVFPSCNQNKSSAIFVCHRQWIDERTKDDETLSFEEKQCCDLLTYRDCFKEAIKVECTSPTDHEKYFKLRMSIAALDVNLDKETGLDDCQKLVESAFFNGCPSKMMKYVTAYALNGIIGFVGAMGFVGLLIGVFWCFCSKRSAKKFPKEDKNVTATVV